MNVVSTMMLGAVVLTFLPVAHSVPRISERDDPELQGVYIKLAGEIQAPFDDVVSRTAGAIEGRGWTIIASYPAGVDAGECTFRGHIITVHVPEYSRRALAHGPQGSFALPLRLAIVQDETGVHVTTANPQSLTRTIISETAFQDDARMMVNTLGQAVADAFPDHARREQYGQMRREGLIHKTMGIIAGGPFADKIETATTVDVQDGETLQTVAERLYAGLEGLAGEWRWKTRPVYLLGMPEHDVAIIGVTSDAIEAKSFAIVRHGADESRRDMTCPGLDHAAAYPIEIVLVREDDRVNVLMIDEMFRMKMYFEDAGRMKFAANMRMPGSIENEIRDKIEDSLY